MRWIRTILPFLAIFLLGCTTPYVEQQRKMYWKWQEGKLSYKEYEQRLKELKNEQPWGGMNGLAERQKEPVFWSGDSDDILSWEGNFLEFLGKSP